MKAILWFLLGVMLAMGGRAIAEEIYSYDSNGNFYSGTYDPKTGNYSVFGNQGSSWGKAPALQAPAPYRHQSPC